MLFSGFTKSVEEGKIKPVYLLTGEESYLHHQIQLILKSKVLTAGSEDFDFETLDGGQFQYENYVNAVRSLPIISPRRLVVFKEFQEVDARSMKPLFAELEGDLSKIVIVYSYVKKPAFSDKSLLTAIKDEYAWVDLSHPRNFKEFNYILRWMLCGKNIDAKLAAVLSESKVDLWQISAWLQQAKDYMDEGATLTLEALQEFADISGIADIWKLTDAVGRRDIKEAQYLLHTLLRNNEKPTFIIWSLKELFIYLNTISKTKRKYGSADSFAKAVNLHQFRYRKYLEACAKFTIEEIENALYKLQESDIRIKSTSGEEESLLVELLDDIIGR